MPGVPFCFGGERREFGTKTTDKSDNSLWECAVLRAGGLVRFLGRCGGPARRDGTHGKRRRGLAGGKGRRRNEGSGGNGSPLRRGRQRGCGPAGTPRQGRGSDSLRQWRRPAARPVSGSQGGAGPGSAAPGRGYTFDADPDRVNLARPCKDGTHVRVPRLSQKQLRERWKRSRG